MTYKNLKDLAPLKNSNDEFAWNIDPEDPMTVVVYHWGQPVMNFWLGEAIESSSRNQVLRHIVDCDNSPWLKRWQAEKYACLIDILRADHAGL